MSLSNAVISKLRILTIAGAVAAIAGVGCAPTASQLQKVLEENPSVLYAAMKKDPAKFIDVINEVAEQAKSQKESQMFEEGFKNPLKPDLTMERTSEGAKDAPITIVEYSDFQCPYCQRGNATMKEVLAAYPDKVKVIFKNSPIERIHPMAMKFSTYYEAIGQKDRAKASQYKSLMFERQEQFNPNEDDQKGVKSREDMMKKYNARIDKALEKVVKELGLNFADVKKAAESPSVAELIKKDQEEAQKFGFTGTPGYIVGGVPVRGAYPIETFKQIIERHLKK